MNNYSYFGLYIRIFGIVKCATAGRVYLGYEVKLCSFEIKQPHENLQCATRFAYHKRA